MDERKDGSILVICVNAVWVFFKKNGGSEGFR